MWRELPDFHEARVSQVQSQGIYKFFQGYFIFYFHLMLYLINSINLRLWIWLFSICLYGNFGKYPYFLNCSKCSNLHPIFARYLGVFINAFCWAIHEYFGAGRVIKHMFTTTYYSHCLIVNFAWWRRYYSDIFMCVHVRKYGIMKLTIKSPIYSISM